MTKKISLLIVFLVMISGCAGKRNATYNVADDGTITHKDTNISFFQPSVGPTDLTRANLINSQAKINEAIAKQIQQGSAGAVIGQYIGVIINQDPRKSVYIYHPSRNEIRKIKPGDYSLFIVSEIPDYISVRFSGEKNNQRMRIWKKSKVYNGIKIDFGARIES